MKIISLIFVSFFLIVVQTTKDYSDKNINPLKFLIKNDKTLKNH